MVATILTVTNANDSGVGSLRDAIAQAHGGDTIVLAASLADQTLILTSGQIAIAGGKSLVIDGVEAPGFTLDANGKSRIFAVGDLAGTASQLTLRHLTLTHGSTAGGGGAIFAYPGAAITVENVLFSGHVADMGGGAIWSSGDAPLTVINSQFVDNCSTTGNNERGGGAIAFLGSADFTVRGSEFRNNHGINGGAINNLNGSLVVENSTFTGNDTLAAKLAPGEVLPTLRGYGGAIYSDRSNGSLDIANCVFANNTARSAGGAVHIFSDPTDTVTIQSSQFQINRAVGLAAGESGNGGAISQVRNLLSTGSFSLLDSTLANNTAADQGGGLWVNNAQAVLTNSTFSGNRAPMGYGGAMTLFSPTAITNCTLAENQARFAGAIAQGNANLVTLKNTIFATNMSTDPTVFFNGNSQTNLPVIDAGGNLQSPDSAAIAPGVLLADPQLGTLTSMNGALVYPLQANSPAINTGVAGAPTTDARSIYRDAQPDIGAVEQSVSVDPNLTAGGLRGEYFNGYFADQFSFFNQTPTTLVRRDATINFQSTPADWDLQGNPVLSDLQTFSVQWRGYIQVPVTGQYRFYLSTDDASFLFLGDAAQAPSATNATISNGGLHAATEVSTTVTLTAGFTPILLLYGQNTSGEVAQLSWSSQDAAIDKQIIPASALFTAPNMGHPGSFAFSASNFSVNDDGTPLDTITINRLGGTDGAVAVTVVPTNGTATAPADYNNAPITVSFADGESQKTIVIPVQNSTQPQPSETVNLALSNPTNGASLGTQATATLTIIDQDFVGLSITGTSVIEGQQSFATFTVNLAGSVAQPVTVDYTTVDGSAIAGLDYTTTTGQLTFAPGDSVKTITVPILNDALPESTESFTARLSNATNAILSNPEAVGIIRDDDARGRADFNQDGQTDIFWYNNQSGQTYVWTMNGLQRASDTAVFPVPDAPNWQVKAIQDFNKDGQSDALWFNATTGQATIWVMNGTRFGTSVSLPQVPVPNWNIVGTGDFNADGNVDIVWANPVTEDVSIWLMNGTQFGSSVNLPKIAGTGWTVAAVTDFNGDRTPDILWRNQISGENLIWELNGTTLGTSLAARSVLPTVSDLNWSQVGVGDFNGDGQTDLLWQNTATGQVAIWRMNGPTYVRDEFFSPTVGKVQSVGDFNGDGIDDILWYDSKTGASGLWYRQTVTSSPLGELSSWQSAPLPTVGPAAGWKALV